MNEKNSIRTAYHAVNLTRLPWSLPLVQSARIVILSAPYNENLRVVCPVTVTHAEGAKRLPAQAMRDAVRSRLSASEAYAKPVGHNEWLPLFFDSADIYDDLKYSLSRYREQSTDKMRAGAVASTILIELGWPITVVADLLSVSRPTIDKWVYAYQHEFITEDDLRMLNDCVFVDVRTDQHIAARTGLRYRKVTFLPPAFILPAMEALWRVAYRTRGASSNQQELRCSKTLDIILMLLVRRGVTAQNIGKLMGVQHAAVLQRIKRSAYSQETCTYAPIEDHDDTAFVTGAERSSHFVKFESSVSVVEHDKKAFRSPRVLCHTDGSDSDGSDSNICFFNASVASVTAKNLYTMMTKKILLTDIDIDSAMSLLHDVFRDVTVDSFSEELGLLSVTTLKARSVRDSDATGKEVVVGVPASSLDSLVKFTTETVVHSEIMEEAKRAYKPHRNRLADLHRFFPERFLTEILAWVADDAAKMHEAGAARAVPLLARCFNEPDAILEEYPAPKKR